jgi:cobalamin biosynthesis protein CbiD
MLRFLLIALVFFQCASVGKGVWSQYTIKYVGSEQELTELVKDLVIKGYLYKIVKHDDGVYEVHYKISDLK